MRMSGTVFVLNLIIFAVATIYQRVVYLKELRVWRQATRQCVDITKVQEKYLTSILEKQ